MKKSMVIAALFVITVVWWFAAAPRDEIRCCIADSITFDPATIEATDAVDQSDKFAEKLEVFSSKLLPYDDAVFFDKGATALVTAHDGKIWRVSIATNTITAEPVADVPLMAWGIHEVPGDPTQVYFCSAGSYEDRPSGEVAGLYRLDVGTREVKPLALVVPDTKINDRGPVVYADDADAPEIKADGSGGEPTREIAVCDNLEVSKDGRRLTADGMGYSRGPR